MYAIVTIAGQQMKVSENRFVYVHRLEGAEGSKVEFNDVLLIDQDGKIKVGTPTVSGASVSAKIISHLQGDKVIVFKKRRRKGYKKLNGHRQQLTKIQIEKISDKGVAKKAVKKEAPAIEEPAKGE
jgi:large subunit ribosomal protein L21